MEYPTFDSLEEDLPYSNDGDRVSKSFYMKHTRVVIDRAHHMPVDVVDENGHTFMTIAYPKPSWLYEDRPGYIRARY